MSMISSETPNNVQSPNHVTHIIQYRHRTLSVRTLRVRELCRHDRDISPVNNQLRNLDAHIGSYIFYKDLYQSNRYDNIRYSLCHWYVTSPRFDRGIFIPSSISLPASLFTRSAIHHPTTNSLVALLARLIVMCITEWAQRDTSPTIGVTNPNLQIRQPNKYLWRHL